MTIAFISDLHLTPERPETTSTWQQFLQHQAPSFQALYILGDLFEYWIGDDASSILGHNKTEKWLKTLTGKGVNVFLMRGNRDFLLGDDFAKRCGCELIKEPYIVDLFGQRTLLLHGDSLCTDDIEHQRWRQKTHSPTWRSTFLSKSMSERSNIALEVRAESEAGKMLKPMQIMDVNQQAVEQTMDSHGVRLLIHGHTHRPAIHHFNLNGRSATRIVLGDWYNQESILQFNETTYSLAPTPSHS